MPSPAEKKKHGGVRRIRTEDMEGMMYRHIYFMNDGTMIRGEKKKRKSKKEKKG